MTVSFALTVDPATRPRMLELYSAEDGDADGHVAAFEWTLLHSARVTERRGEAVAAIPRTHIAAEAAAYRAVVRFHDGAPYWDGWSRRDLTYADW